MAPRVPSPEQVGAIPTRTRRLAETCAARVGGLPGPGEVLGPGDDPHSPTGQCGHGSTTVVLRGRRDRHVYLVPCRGTSRFECRPAEADAEPAPGDEHRAAGERRTLQSPGDSHLAPAAEPVDECGGYVDLREPTRLVRAPPAYRAPLPFEMRIDEVSADTIRWSSVGQFPPHRVGTDITWALTAAESGTLVHFSHNGWTSDEGPFAGSALTWGALMFSLKSYIETGTGQPLYRRP